MINKCRIYNSLYTLTFMLCTPIYSMHTEDVAITQNRSASSSSAETTELKEEFKLPSCRDSVKLIEALTEKLSYTFRISDIEGFNNKNVLWFEKVIDVRDHAITYARKDTQEHVRYLIETNKRTVIPQQNTTHLADQSKELALVAKKFNSELIPKRLLDDGKYVVAQNPHDLNRAYYVYENDNNHVRIQELPLDVDIPKEMLKRIEFTVSDACESSDKNVILLTVSAFDKKMNTRRPALLKIFPSPKLLKTCSFEDFLTLEQLANKCRSGKFSNEEVLKEELLTKLPKLPKFLKATFLLNIREQILKELAEKEDDEFEEEFMMEIAEYEKNERKKHPIDFPRSSNSLTYLNRYKAINPHLPSYIPKDKVLPVHLSEKL